MFTPIRIADLVQEKLTGRKIDLVGFVDALLAIAADVGEIRCILADERRLRFYLGRQDACEVEVDEGRSKLRMLCARLSVLCNEMPAATISPYGGEGMIRAPAHNGEAAQQWTVDLKNTPAQQEFTLRFAKVENSPIADRWQSVP